MTVLLLGAVTIGNPFIIGNPLIIANPYERTQARGVFETVGLLPTSRSAAESTPPVHLDENGWPQDFWTNLRTVDQDFSLGDRDEPHERFDPVKDD